MRRATFAIVLVGALAVGACGRKTMPKPPQLVAPRAVQELSLATQSGGILVRWTRPTEYVDGSDMKDLGGFVVVVGALEDAAAVALLADLAGDAPLAAGHVVEAAEVPVAHLDGVIAIVND